MTKTEAEKAKPLVEALEDQHHEIESRKRLMEEAHAELDRAGVPRTDNGRKLTLGVRIRVLAVREREKRNHYGRAAWRYVQKRCTNESMFEPLTLRVAIERAPRGVPAWLEHVASWGLSGHHIDHACFGKGMGFGGCPALEPGLPETVHLTGHSGFTDCSKCGRPTRLGTRHVVERSGRRATELFRECVDCGLELRDTNHDDNEPPAPTYPGDPWA